MIPYILHVTVITTICFLFYKLLLRKETFYRLNRWTLMGCLAVSFALPLFPVPQTWSWRDKWQEPAAAAQPQATVLQKNIALKEVVSAPPAVVGSAVRLEALDNHPADPRRSGRIRSRRHVHGAASPASPVSADAQQLATVSETPVSDRQFPMFSETPAIAGVTSMAGTSSESSGNIAGATSVASASNKSGNTAGVMSVAGTGNESSNTAGTPVEKNGAGTLARFFSGATLLLALQWLFYGYMLGVLLFGANFLLQVVVLLYQSYSRPVIRDGHFRIVEIGGNRAPCSFGNTIFINPALYDWETYNQILIHEKIHVSGRHTLDILLAEIALVIQWFNPFAWLYRREVENNLEFLTDANVLLDETIERQAYQLSLLRVSAPHLPYSITNNYNQSLLKRRIVMMNSKRSAFHTVWKYFFLIPLLTCLMCALNKPAIALGAATKKLSLAHAPLFRILAPLTDTLKKPTRSSDSVSAGESAPDKASSGGGHGRGTGSIPDSGTDEGTDEGIGNSSGAGNGESSSSSMGSGISAGDSYAVATTIGYGNEAIAVKKAVKVKVYANVSVAALPVEKVYARPTIEVRPDIKLAELPRFSFVEDSVLTDGSWYATSYGDRLGFELKAEDEDHSWSYTMHVDKSEINPFPGQGNVEFKLVREAGTIVFKGQFDGQEGFGHFHFTPDAAYFPALKQLGVEDLEDRRQFGFFAMNIKKEYVTMLAHNGYPHLSARDLLSLAAMHVDEAFIQYWHGVDFGDGDATEPRTLIRLKALHIDRAYVDELKAAGYDHLSLRELESLKSQHIDRDYIRSLGRGQDNQPIPVRELVSYKALHIDSAYLQNLRKIGYDNLTMRDVTSLYSMHVTPDYIQQLQGLGYKDLSARDLCNLMAMHVTPDYIKGFRDIGYTDLSARDLDNLKAMNVKPEVAKGYKDMGYKNLDARALGTLMAMNVTPEFAKAFADLGYTDLQARDLASLKAMGVTPDFVAGFTKLGFDHIPVRTLTSLKATGVTPDYVAKMKAQGFVSKDLGKYIRLKTDFN
jgi:BlaR1 peptidase M56